MDNSCLILLAHGSKDPKWSRSFETLVGTCQGRSILAYMDFMKPSLFSVVEKLKNHNVNEIKILPLFMSGGGHIDKDIPEQVKELKAKYPSLDFKVLPPIGEHQKLISSMREIIMDYASQ